MTVHSPSSTGVILEHPTSPRAVLGYHCGDIDSLNTPQWLSRLPHDRAYTFRQERSNLIRKFYDLAYLQPNLRTVCHTVVSPLSSLIGDIDYIQPQLSAAIIDWVYDIAKLSKYHDILNHAHKHGFQGQVHGYLVYDE